MDVHTARWQPSRGWSRPLPDRDGDRTLVLVYGGSGLLDDAGPLREVLDAFPRAAVVGCSTAGEILGDTVADDTVTVAVARFERTRLSVVHEEVARPGLSRDAGLAVGSRLLAAEPDLQAVLVLSDGLGVNGSALVAGLVEGTGGRAVITGGLAGDGPRFGRTWVLVDGQPRAGWVSAVGLAGPDLEVGHASRGGWSIFGPERRITRSEGNVLLELDGQPALELYKRYLGDRAAELPASALLFPLAVRVPGAADRPLVRTVLAVSEEDQSMTFAGDVPAGALAQLMRANTDQIIDAAHQAAEAVDAVDAAQVVGAGCTGATLAVAVSCIGRRLLLGRRVEDELEALLAGLPEGAELVGFYSYGEISPITAGTCDLHNQTMTVTTLRERG